MISDDVQDDNIPKEPEKNNKVEKNKIIEKESYENIELTDDLKKEIIILTLESSPYNYNVVRVVTDYDKMLGNYASIGMIAKGKTTSDIASQVGTGIGTLYGIWDDKNYYIVALNNYVDICTFGIDGDITRNFMNGKISDTEYFLNLQSVCNPVN